jgi:hypothetical protein
MSTESKSTKIIKGYELCNDEKILENFGYKKCSNIDEFNFITSKYELFDWEEDDKGLLHVMYCKNKANKDIDFYDDQYRYMTYEGRKVAISKEDIINSSLSKAVNDECNGVNKNKKILKCRQKNKNRKNRNKLPKSNDDKLIKCFICSKSINCGCINEQTTRLKYRSCATTNGYPRSQLFENQLIHLCSKVCNIQCNNKFIENLKKRSPNVNIIDISNSELNDY